MRNLKRALSLTLASVMLLGMMVVGASAAAGYDDVKDTDNVEAIEVLQAIEVMVGDERGFGPERPVNRAEMAVVMGKLLNLDYNYYATSCPFNDVYDWARGWVGACYANKIVSGRGDGIYDPGATVTAVEASSMLMRALGYFQYANDVADGFELSTVRQGTKIGIYDGVGSSATEPMTRNQVAQMVLNALRSGMVEPDGNTINLTTPDGSVFTGKVNYVFRTSAKPFARAISPTQATAIGSQNGGPIVELGEQLYDGKLKLNDYRTDDFERPARNWEYDGKEIGTYVKKELLRQSYTNTVTGKDLYELLSKNTIEDRNYGFVIAIDGETDESILDPNGNTAPYYGYFTRGNLVRTNTEKVGNTGKGVLTEVYVDTDPGYECVYIAIINTYLAKANDDYNDKKDEVSYEVWSAQNLGAPTDPIIVKDTNEKEDLTVSGEDFAIKDVKEGDISLVTIAKGEIQTISAPEVIDNTELVSFKNGSWVKADAQYDYASSASYNDDVLDHYDRTNMKDTAYRLFLDKYGYMIGIEIIEEPEQYVFLTGIDTNTSNLANKTADGNIIHLDGTMETVKINMDKSENAQGQKFKSVGAVAATGTAASPTALNDQHVNENETAFVWNTNVSAVMNTWCKYSVNASGVYTLTEVANSNDSWTAKTKAGQGKDVDTSSSPANDVVVTLNKSHIYLKSDISDMQRVYTNDDTVFLSVDTEEITHRTLPQTVGGSTAVIISDVNSVTTGHQNVNLKAWAADKVVGEGEYGVANTNYGAVSNGVYTLFDDDGFVIAAVVVGEDDGTTTNYAFILDGDLDQEDWGKSEDEWTWYRRAIVNGEEVKLLEKGGSNPDLANVADGGEVRQGEWHQVKYYADGTVRSVENLSTGVANVPSTYVPLYDFKGYTSAWTSGKYIKAISDVEAATDKENNVLLWQNLTDTDYSVTADGHSLYIKTATTAKEGFSVSPDAKTVLVQDVYLSKDNKTKIMDNVEEYTNGKTGLERAVKRINPSNASDKYSFKGFVGAVFNDQGLATSIVIYDKTATYLNQGTDIPGGGPVGGDTMTVKVNFLLANGNLLSSKDYTFIDNGTGVVAVVPDTTVDNSTTPKLVAIPTGYDIKSGTATGSTAAFKADKDNEGATVTMNFIAVPKTKTLTLDAGAWGYTWTDEPTKGITGDSGHSFTNDTPVNVPYGAKVTVTAGTAGNGYYQVKVGSDPAMMVESGGTFDVVVTANTTIDVTDTGVDGTPDKFALVEIGRLNVDNINVANGLNGLGLSLAFNDTTNLVTYAGKTYAKGGTAFKVTFTMSNNTDAAITSGSKKIQAVIIATGSSAGVASTTYDSGSAAADVFDASQAVAAGANKTANDATVVIATPDQTTAYVINYTLTLSA